MGVYVRKVRPEPKKARVVTDETRQKPFKPAAFPRICRQCNTTYNYRPAAKDKGHEHKRGLFCSWDCKSQHIKDNKPGPSSTIYAGYCITCSAPFVSKTAKKYCRAECRPSDGPTPSRAGALMTRDCATCSVSYQFKSKNGRPQWFCSDACRDEMKAAQRRIAGAANKAKRRAAAIEKVDPFVVFDRDGWKCRICGIDTPRDKRSTHAADAPELDHIIPIAKGGKHSYENTQCACRRCNIQKSDKILPNISSVNNLLSMLPGGHVVLPSPSVTEDRA